MCGNRWIKEVIPKELNNSILSYYYRWRFKTNTEAYAHVFICNLDTVNELNERWKKLVNDIAFNIQSETQSLLERSNFYACFWVKGEVPTNLIAEIENDTYCARKIVVSKEETYEFDIETELAEIEKRIFSFHVDVEENNLRTINQIEMENFRAYRGKSTYDFTTKNGKTAKLSVLFAPNGVGKTTVFDALEWNLTGSIKRLDELVGDIPEGRILKNYDAGEDEKASVKVTFSDGNFVYGDIPKINNRSKKDYNPGKRHYSDAMKELVITKSRKAAEKKANIEKNRKVWDKILLTHDRIDDLLSDQKPEETYKEWMEICGIEDVVTDTFTRLYQAVKENEKQIKDNKQTGQTEEKKLEQLEGQRPKLDELQSVVENYNSITKWSSIPAIDFDAITEAEYRHWSGQIEKVREELDGEKKKLDAKRVYLNDYFEPAMESLQNIRKQFLEYQGEIEYITKKMNYQEKEKELIDPYFVVEKGQEWFLQLKDYLLNSDSLKKHQEQFFDLVRKYDEARNKKGSLQYTISKKEALLKQTQELYHELLQHLKTIRMTESSIEEERLQIREAEKNAADAKLILTKFKRIIDKLEHMELSEKDLNTSYLVHTKDEYLEKVRSDIHQHTQKESLLLEEHYIYREVLPLLTELINIVSQRTECINSRDKVQQKISESQKFQGELESFLENGREIIRQSNASFCPLCHTEFSSLEELLKASYSQRALENKEDATILLQFDERLLGYNRDISDQLNIYNKVIRNFLVEYNEKLEAEEQKLSTLNNLIQTKKKQVTLLENRIQALKQADHEANRYFDYSEEGIRDWISNQKENLELQMDILQRDVVRIEKELDQIEVQKNDVASIICQEEDSISKIPGEIYQKPAITESVKAYVSVHEYEEICKTVNRLSKDLEILKAELVRYETEFSSKLARQIPDLSHQLQDATQRYEKTRQEIIQKRIEINSHFDNRDFETLDMDKEKEFLTEELNCLVFCQELLSSVKYEYQLECYFRDWKMQNSLVKDLKKASETLKKEKTKLSRAFEDQKTKLKESILEKLEKFPISEIYEKLDPHLEFKTLTFSFDFNADDKPCLSVKVVDRDGKEFAPEWYFSSAQLNIVAFAIYIGKALKTENLPANTIMIDDPIGHFSDINIIGFVDLLRNIVENTNRQMIISTHDSRIFNLIKRKIPATEYPAKYYDCRNMKESIG